MHGCVSGRSYQARSPSGLGVMLGWASWRAWTNEWNCSPPREASPVTHGTGPNLISHETRPPSVPGPIPWPATAGSASIPPMRRHSVAEELLAAQRHEVARLSPEERVRLALQLGSESIELLRSRRGLTVDEARRASERQRDYAEEANSASTSR